MDNGLWWGTSKPHPPAHPGLGKTASVWPEEARFLALLVRTLRTSLDTTAS